MQLKNNGFVLVIGFLLIMITNLYSLNIDIYDNLTDNLVINNQEITGRFDLNSKLEPTLFTNPLDINSGFFSFNFSDNGDAYIHTSLTTMYAAESSSSYYRNRYDFYSDPFEQATLKISDMVMTDSTDYFNYNYYTGTYYDTSHAYTSGPWYDRETHYEYYYTRKYDAYSGYSGNFTISGYLNLSGLEDLAADGIIDFSVIGQGDIRLDSGRLDLDVNETPEVPEPGTIFLFLSGLAGILLIGSKKNLLFGL